MTRTPRRRGGRWTAALAGFLVAAALACAAREAGSHAASDAGAALDRSPDARPGRATAQPPPSAEPPYLIYVGAESADAVVVVEPGTWKVRKQIPVGISVEDIEGVHALAVSPDERHWYISLAHGFPYGTLWKFSVQGDSLVARATVGNFPATIALTPDGAWAFVVNYNLHGDKAIDTISAVYTETMTEVTKIPACVKPHGLDVSRDGRFVIATCTRDDTIVKIDVGTLKESARGSLRLPEEEAAGKDCYPTGAQIAPAGDVAYVSCGHGNEVRVVDLAGLEVRDRIAECAGAYLLRLDPEGRRLWVPCRGGGEFVIIDTATKKIVGRVKTTREFPHTAAFSPDGRYALLTQESKGVIPGALDVVDRETLEKVATVDVGLQATGVGVIASAASPPTS